MSEPDPIFCPWCDVSEVDEGDSMCSTCDARWSEFAAAAISCGIPDDVNMGNAIELVAAIADLAMHERKCRLAGQMRP